MFYTTKILPAKIAINDVSVQVESAPSTPITPSETDVETSEQGMTTVPTTGTPSATADTAIDADISAIAADADSAAAYDDSSVEAGIIGGATSVTNAYGI
jgi:hypothetical protein